MRARSLPADTVDGLRWTPPHDLHLTLRFLGQVPRSRIPALRAVVSAVAATTTPFVLALGHLSWLGGRSGVLAADVRGGEPVEELHDRLSAGLEGVGFEPVRRPFRPHLTVARPRGRQRSRRPDRRGIARADTLVGLSWRAEAMVLFESHLGPDRARHEPLEIARFGA